MLAGKHQNKSKVEVSGFFFYVVSCPFYCSGICICPHVSLCDRKYEEMQASFELGLGRYKIDMRNRADRTQTHTHSCADLEISSVSVVTEEGPSRRVGIRWTKLECKDTKLMPTDDSSCHSQTDTCHTCFILFQPPATTFFLKTSMQILHSVCQLHASVKTCGQTVSDLLMQDFRSCSCKLWYKIWAKSPGNDSLYCTHQNHHWILLAIDPENALYHNHRKTG